MANWLFQGNPARYEVMAQLEAQDPINALSITRHADDMRPGDRAALWLSGARDGIHVLGTITGPPFDDVKSDGWPKEEQGQAVTFASLLLDEFLPEPITRAELLADPRFQAARIITQPQAGNPFLTTDSEWAAIEDRHTGGSASKPVSRNPTWATDELILALDLYLRAGMLGTNDQRVTELSDILNALPIHTVRPDAQRFRNPNGVALKLANFAALDPSYDGAGMSRGGKGVKGQ